MTKCVLGDVAKRIQTGPFGSQLHQSDYSLSGTPVVMPKDLSDGTIVDATIARVGPLHVERLARHKLKEGDLLFSRRGDVGRCALVRKEQEGWLCGTGCLRVELDVEKADYKYLYYFLRRDDVAKWLESHAVGAIMLNINPSIVSQLPVVLPSLDAQHNIAKVLSTIDRKIALNRKRIATLEAMAKEIYDYWFVQFDFPDAHGRPYKSSGGAMVYNPDLKREIPKGWEVKPLGELMKTNASSYNERTLPSRIRYIDIAAVSNGVVSSKTEYDRDHAPGRARRIAKRGDTIWSSVRPNLRAYALVLNPQEDDVFSTGFTVLSPIDVPYGFLYLTVTAEAYVSYLISRTGNSAYPAVLPSAFGEYEIAVPPRDLLDRFADQVEGAFERRQNCFDEIQGQTSLRDFLLPLLMNGQVKVA